MFICGIELASFLVITRVLLQQDTRSLTQNLLQCLADISKDLLIESAQVVKTLLKLSKHQAVVSFTVVVQ